VTTVVAATRFEARAARRALGGRAPVVRVGVGCARRAPVPGGPVVVFGLAGALSTRLPRGTVLVPEAVGLEAAGGETAAEARCDPALTDALRRAAARLGLPHAGGRLLTTAHLVVGDERRRWAGRGFDAVDMETGLLFGDGRSVAACRVILDGPDRELAAAWERPALAALRPGLWPQLLELARAAPGLAARGAAVVRAAVDER
jgi:hypothetical protein